MSGLPPCVRFRAMVVQFGADPLVRQLVPATAAQGGERKPVLTPVSIRTVPVPVEAVEPGNWTVKPAGAPCHSGSVAPVGIVPFASLTRVAFRVLADDSPR